MGNPNDTRPVQVFAGNAWQANMVKSMLSDAGIEAYVIDEIMGTFNPWWVAAGGAGAVKVFVPESALEEANRIVTGFEETQR